ncbi:MAG: sulfotransferase [Alphaproteobacteria bacterium]|nr:sulfotransferase [Alphaproteobacteria bacterium]
MSPVKMSRTNALLKHTQLSARLSEAKSALRHINYASRLHAEASTLLASLGRRQEAEDELSAAAQLFAPRAEDCEALAFAAFQIGAHRLAHEFYGRVVELVPHDATAWYNFATSQRNLGFLQEAEFSSTRSLALDPQLVQAALLRSHLRKQQPGNNHVDELRQLLVNSENNATAQIFLNYALGKELDDLSEYKDAFTHFATGAHTRRLHLNYDVKVDLDKIERLREVYPPAMLKAARHQGRATEYAFILGLPRSGTTLIERVLTGHPLVTSNGETDNFLAALQEGLDGGTDDIFARAARADSNLVYSAYVQRTGSPPPGGILLEKLPLNYLYVGAICLAIPNAQILLLRRSPADNAFGMYSTLFSNGYPFSYDLGELAEYYLAYHRLTEHWKRHLGDRILEVSYEHFIAQPQTLGPKITGHLGLSWNDKMLLVEQNQAPSATASAAQIRKPIYRTSIGRWRSYATGMGKFIDRISAAGLDP